MENIKRLKDLQNKEIVNIIDGSKIGFIDDLEIDISTGKIQNILIFQKNKSFGFLEHISSEYIIEWDEIKMIGNQTILVEIQDTFKEEVKEEK